MPEGLQPFTSNPFFRITDFAVPKNRVIIGLAEYDDTEDLAYIYDQNGGFIESKPGVPRDDPLGHYNHTMFTKVGASIYSIDGGQSNYDIYKDGVGWAAGNGSVSYLTNYGGSLWLLRAAQTSSVQEIDAATGAGLSSHNFTEWTTRHRTNGTHHVVTYFDGNSVDPEWRLRHVLLNSSWQEIKVLKEYIHPVGQSQVIDYLDVAISSDRVAVVVANYNIPVTSTIYIFDLAGNLKDTLTNPGQAEMLLMNESKLYASDALTGAVTIWDITEVAGEKVYSDGGGFTTDAPWVWYGNLSS